MAATISGGLFRNSKNKGLTLVIRPSSVSTSKYSTSSPDGPRRPVANPRPETQYDPSLSQLRRGTGGRSSFNGIVATVFGASGFLGMPICNRLGKIGTQLIIPYRGSDYDIRPLKLVGDLGQVLFQPYYLKDEDSIRRAVKYSNVVINLVGRDWQTRNFSFDDVHVTGARAIARISREEGVKRLIHFSSLNASPNPTPLMLRHGSQYLRSKYEGEQAVLEEFPSATIFRPADVFGQADRILFYYAGWWRRNFYNIPLYRKGEQTVKQPVYSGDVATAVVNALRDPESAGKTYDIAGPKRYRLSELVDYIFRVVRRTPEFGYRRTNLLWSPTFRLKLTLNDLFLPSWPLGYLGWDKVEKDHVTDTLTKGNPRLDDLGIQATDLESRIEWELFPLRHGLYYEEELGEFAPPAPPKVEAWP